MRQSKLFTKTVKTAPKDIKLASHKLLYQAGFIRESVAGRYYFLPLGMKVRDKIVGIIESEMNRTGAIKMITPVLHPLELWKETNRTDAAGFELMTVKDRNDGEFALGGTAEEMMVDLVRKFNLSYRDLPFNIYQFSQKFRDELRARGGLLRVREFLMKDAYSFHADEKDFKREYKVMGDTYTEIFKQMGLKTFVAEADNGYIGGDYCHEFIVKNDVGESKILVSKDGKYVAHEDIAKFKRDEKNLSDQEEKMVEIDARRGNTMEDGVKLHKLPLWQQMKDLMVVDEKDQMILAVVRGDFDINEVKLKNVVGAASLRHATEEEIRKIGSEPGFISPIGINRKKVKVVGDISLKTIKNAYTGANKKNKDLLNVNYKRDYDVDIEADIALAKAGYLNKDGQKLEIVKGIEVGNIFQLGQHYSKLMKATFVDKKGKDQYYYMGCYGIGVGRTMAAIVEMHHDDKGIIWPEPVAPFKVHLINLMNDMKEADGVYKKMMENNIDVLYDDRDKAAGEKFADADLIGIPWRVVVSEKTLAEDSVEIKRRGSDKAELVKIAKVVDKLK